MTQEEKRIKLAEFRGYERRNQHDAVWVRNGMKIYTVTNLPDCFNDLNVVHELEKLLPYTPDYMFFLRQVVGGFSESQCEWCDYDWANVVSATASQRAEALGLTFGLWKN